MTKPFQRVAFCGFSRSGKNTAAQCLINAGYANVSFGAIIKRQLDPLVQEHFGFSAFTEIENQKRKIRPLMEFWGDLNYQRISDEFFGNLPETAVNTRLVRAEEGERWIKAGGIILHVMRNDHCSASEWEAENQELLLRACPTKLVLNDGTDEGFQRLWDQVLEAVGLPASPPHPQP